MRTGFSLLAILLFATACDAPLANNPFPVRDPTVRQSSHKEPARFVRYDEMEPDQAAAIRKGVLHVATRSPARAQTSPAPVRYGVSVQPLEGQNAAIVVRDPAAGALVILGPAADDHSLALADAALGRDLSGHPVPAARRVIKVDRNGMVHDLSENVSVQMNVQIVGVPQTVLTGPMLSRARTRPAQLVPGVGPVKIVD